MTNGREVERRYGKYRGTVVNNVDPMTKGRVQVQVPAVYGTNTLNWALPCTPYGGAQEGFFFIPPIGANIWVEFEGGDIDFPIWSGCFWGDGECPGGLPQTKILKTPVATVTIDELNPAAPVTITTVPGDTVTITATGVTLQSASGAKVELTGPQVSINNGALEVI